MEDALITLRRFGIVIGALFIVVLAVVVAVMAAVWLMQFGLSRVFMLTSATRSYSSQDEFRTNISCDTFTSHTDGVCHA